MASAARGTGTALERGNQAYQQGDFATAASLWRPLAKAGDRDAQFALGTLYQQGLGVAQDDLESTRWFQRAAKQGSVPAQYNLGNAYKFGRGVKASDKAAFQWWLKAAQAGLAPAQFNVGTAYFYGRGVTQSTEQGLVWYRKAADNGHPGAQAVLNRLIANDDTRSASSHRISGPDWIRSQPPNHFTVQLLAAEDEAAARRFIASLPDGKYALGPYRSRSKRWVAVITGSFASEAAANVAAHQWQTAAKPWVREFSALQSQLSD